MLEEKAYYASNILGAPVSLLTAKDALAILERACADERRDAIEEAARYVLDMPSMDHPISSNDAARVARSLRFIATKEPKP